MFTIKLHKHFLKSFEKCEKDLKDKIISFLELLKNAEKVGDVEGIKKLSGYSGFYRMRLGGYRIGFRLQGESIEILILKSRGDFYKIFPKNYG